jgi:serine/threonine-protein kinase
MPGNPETQKEILKRLRERGIPGYKIEGILGSGAMAIVFRGRQTSLNRIVAIKVLRSRLAKNENYVRRFHSEGRSAAKLNHHNIVSAIDVGQEGEYHYFVMEYVEGDTIDAALKQGKVFKEKEALNIIIQVARALKHAHEHWIIHRDVKPKNIMITNEGVVKLADMGIARELTDIAAIEAEKGQAWGTPYYIAPEQIRGKMDVDGRADIYSLGATLYHMVTGRVPFYHEDRRNIMNMHLHTSLTPPDHINKKLSIGISEMIEIMMKKNPEDRYQNIKILIEDIESLLKGEPPIRAHQSIDVSSFSPLASGDFVPPEMSALEYEIIIRRQRVALIVCVVSLVLVILILIIFLMLLL